MGAGPIVAVGSPYALSSRAGGANEGRLRAALLPLLNCACGGDPSLQLISLKQTTPTD